MMSNTDLRMLPNNLRASASVSCWLFRRVRISSSGCCKSVRQSLSLVYCVLSAGSLVELGGACAWVEMAAIVEGRNGQEIVVGFAIVRIIPQVRSVVFIYRLVITNHACRFAAR